MIYIFPLSWMDDISPKTHDMSEEMSLSLIQEVIVQYNSLQEGFSLFFFLFFDFSQVSIIVNLFNSISYSFQESHNTMEIILWAFDFLLYALYHIFMILAFTLTAERAFHSIKGLKEDLQKRECKNKNKGLVLILAFEDLSEDEDENFEIRRLLNKIENIEPFSGKGFFYLTRSNLTSMLSISITYLIILLQFKLA